METTSFGHKCARMEMRKVKPEFRIGVENVAEDCPMATQSFVGTLRRETLQTSLINASTDGDSRQR